MTWDSWMLQRLHQRGFETAVYPVHKFHTRRRKWASTHGKASYLLGRPIEYVLIRPIQDLLRGNPLLSLSFIMGNLEYQFRRPEKEEIAPYVHHVTRYRVAQATKRKILTILRRRE
jgi:hypothetical protein